MTLQRSPKRPMWGLNRRPSLEHEDADGSSGEPQMSALHDVSDALADLVERLSTHIVRIHGARQRGLTGVILDDAHLVTSSRALRRDEGLRADFATKDGRDVELELLGRDPGSDLALLRFDPDAVEANPAPPVWRSDAPRPGDLAVAVARPGRSTRASLGMLGVVGGAFEAPGGGRIDRYLELDRDLPRGFAGGLLCDVRGAAIGLVTPGILRGVTVTLPSSTLVRVAAHLRQHGHVPRGYLGVGVYPASLPAPTAGHVGRTRAVAVVALEHGGPAAAAGLQVGDIITSLDASPIDSPWSLRAALADKGGTTATLGILRAGAAQDLEIAVESRP